MSDRPVLPIVVLNGSEAEAIRIMEILKRSDLAEDFDLIASTEPFAFESPEAFAGALETVILTLRKKAARQAESQ